MDDGSLERSRPRDHATTTTTTRHVTSRHVVLSRRRSNESNPSSASIHHRRPNSFTHQSRAHPRLARTPSSHRCVTTGRVSPYGHTERDRDPAPPPRRRAPRGCLCSKHTTYRVNTKKTTKGEGPFGRSTPSPFKRSIHGRRGTSYTTRARRAMRLVRLVRAAVSHVGGWVMGGWVMMNDDAWASVSSASRASERRRRGVVSWYSYRAFDALNRRTRVRKVSIHRFRFIQRGPRQRLIGRIRDERADGGGGSSRARGRLFGRVHVGGSRGGGGDASDGVRVRRGESSSSSPSGVASSSSAAATPPRTSSLDDAPSRERTRGDRSERVRTHGEWWESVR